MKRKIKIFKNFVHSPRYNDNEFSYIEDYFNKPGFNVLSITPSITVQGSDIYAVITVLYEEDELYQETYLSQLREAAKLSKR